MAMVFCLTLNVSVLLMSMILKGGEVNPKAGQVYCGSAFLWKRFTAISVLCIFVFVLNNITVK